jgi:hypothetical protein
MNEPPAAAPSMPSRKAVPRWLQSFFFYYPFTLAGTLLLAAAAYLLGRGLAQDNPYGVLLALLALLVLAVLSVAGRLQARGLRVRQPHWHWDASIPMYARRAGLQQALITDRVRILPFFRAHFGIRGNLKVGRNAGLRFSREISFTQGTRHPIRLYFPLCGLFSGSGRFSVQDIFGLTRSRFGGQPRRTLPVQPASFTQGDVPIVQPAVGFEETSRKRSSDEEKYYMREYLPGDRFRDINWKVSSRLAELITRISPVTQEKTTILPVYLRNFSSSERENLESIMHLNVMKSWLLAFLRAMKQEYPEMQFQVASGSGNWLLASDEDIDRFSRELAGLFYQREAGASLPTVPEEELFVFSTGFDRGLPAFLSSQARANLYIFRTVFPRSGADEEANPLVLFQPPCACLPGPWLLRREPHRQAPRLSAPASGRLEEQALSVRVL